ncbi:MAG: Omp28-related outer membrane protein, partial [Bacteroidales bacterium]|nr:Omp28-related outer membrane protein [Bacteroidales bacterium]
MKKFTFALLAVLAFSFSLKAQQYVSTEPSNRNVIIEEFTGRNCGYCPDGHVVANGIVHANPGRAWAINIHAGSFSPTSYPNLQCQDGITIHNGFSISGYPAGTVNRCGGTTSYGRGQWSSLANTQLGQASEVNIGGRVIINPTTRVATITVEVYYTADAADQSNQLTVAMLQDSIWGGQSGGSSNPEQWVGGQYCHMHILRDVVNASSAWGETITPTTAGTLITREYTYEIPEMIGNPNGVDVDIENVHFLAWVAKNNFYILSGNELEVVQGSDEPLSPFLKNVAQESSVTCTHAKVLQAQVMNGGTDHLTSLSFETEIAGETFTTQWNGDMAQFDQVTIDLPVEVPFGTHDATVKIVSANGQAWDASKTASVNCMEWTDLAVETEKELKLELMQDKFGNQITWEVTASNGDVLASGGPYTMLMGATATQMHIEHFTVPANECVKFTIYDNVGNGICCAYGQGYYIVYDDQDNVIFGDESNGEFGSEASYLISTGDQITVEMGDTEVEIISYTEANFACPISYQNFPEEAGFEYRKVTSSTVNTVVGMISEFQNIMASVNDLEASSIYVVKPYAIVGGTKFYGKEITFNTWTEG